MSLESELHVRSESKCELCNATNNLKTYTVSLESSTKVQDHALLCETCIEQIDNPEKVDVNHWRILNDTMWNTEPAVQVLVWRMLTRLKNEGWPQDLLDMLYLDDETLEWAKATGEGVEISEGEKHRDCNGVELLQGDSVVLIQDLNVKGTSIVAKRGTAVRNINLDKENTEYIEGKVNGQTIVIITKFVKKTS